MKRGLVLAKYDQLAASTRQRIGQMEPYLAAHGITIDIKPLFDNQYLENLFLRGQRDPLTILRAYWQRIDVILQANRYDFVWVQYELFPYFPGLFERMAGTLGKPIFYDIDDAIFHQYDQHKNPVVRAVLGEKLRPLLKQVSLAFCGNRYLQKYVARDCAETLVVPTVVNVEQYLPRSAAFSGLPVLGWIGSPSTWNYCKPLIPMLKEHVEQGKLRVLVIGAGKGADTSLPFEFCDWHEENEIADIQRMDMGIMPIPNEPWARGKCGYKLIQYMACALPVIASPVGVNTEIVTHGVNGFLASDEADWKAALVQLCGDAGLRTRMGIEGRKIIEAHYSLQVHGPRLAQAMRAKLV